MQVCSVSPTKAHTQEFPHRLDLLLSWLPKMLAEQGVDISSAGLLALLPHLAAFTMSNCGAAVADRVLLPRVGLTRTRKLLQALANHTLSRLPSHVETNNRRPHLWKVMHTVDLIYLQPLTLITRQRPNSDRASHS